MVLTTARFATDRAVQLSHSYVQPPFCLSVGGKGAFVFCNYLSIVR